MKTEKTGAKKKIEYRVREVKRYAVTRYHEDGPACGVETCGIFDREDEALRVGFALAKMDLEEFRDKVDLKFPDFPANWSYY